MRPQRAEPGSRMQVGKFQLDFRKYISLFQLLRNGLGLPGETVSSLRLEVCRQWVDGPHSVRLRGRFLPCEWFS